MQKNIQITVEEDCKVAEGQYRLGPAGMVMVHSARGKIDNSVIHHAEKETGVVFGVTQILVRGKDKKSFEIPSLCDNWQHHTIASIEEKWPKVLVGNSLFALMNC